MTAYLEQINKKIEVKTRKLANLEEYRQNLLTKSGQLDANALAERLEQIDEEYNALEKSIRINTKTKTIFEAAYKELLELRILDGKLQNTTSPSEKEELENSVIQHTAKLQEYLGRLPEKLIAELQQKYLMEAENEPLVEEKEEENPVMEPITLDQTNEIPVESSDDKVDENLSLEITDDSVVESIPEENEDSDNNNSASRIYVELLQIFDAEKREMSEIEFFDDASELEKFLDKYKELKMECHARLLAAIEAEFEEENTETDSSVNSKEELDELIEIPVTGEAPIIIMLDLVDKLEIMNDPNKKLHPVNISVSESFKEELTNGNWLYNVIHYTAELASVIEENDQELMARLSKLEANQKRLDVLRERVANLSKINLAKVYNEYYANNSVTRLTTALKVLLDEAINKLV